MKKYWKEVILGLIVVLFIIPLVLAFLLRFDFIITDTSSGWIGFWGSYLGGIVGGLITLYVLFRTLKENREMQKKEHKIAFCNEICKLSGEICGAINRECIYILKYADKKNGSDKDDLFNAMLAKNKASELLHICSAQLISKIKDVEFIGAEKLMDKIAFLSQTENEIDIRFAYTVDEENLLRNTCDRIKPILGEMREWIVEFLENNISDSH